MRVVVFGQSKGWLGLLIGLLLLRITLANDREKLVH